MWAHWRAIGLGPHACVGRTHTCMHTCPHLHFTRPLRVACAPGQAWQRQRWCTKRFCACTLEGGVATLAWRASPTVSVPGGSLSRQPAVSQCVCPSAMTLRKSNSNVPYGAHLYHESPSMNALWCTSTNSPPARVCAQVHAIQRSSSDMPAPCGNPCCTSCLYRDPTSGK